MPAAEVTLGARTGGFPCQSIIRSVIRSMQRPDLIVEILRNHPHAGATLNILRAGLDKIERAIRLGETVPIESSMAAAREQIELNLREEISWTAGELIRLEADFRKPKLIFTFPAEMNQLGLMTRVMGEFDRLGIDKTSVFAHNLPDGGCRFIIGVDSIDQRVEECEKKIRSWVA